MNVHWKYVELKLVWHSLAKDVELWSWGCLSCQQSKIQTHIKYSVPSIQFLVGTLLTFPSIWLIHLPWVRSFLHPDNDWMNLPLAWGYSIDPAAESCVHAFISTWFSRFNVPALLTSDRGAQFTSYAWARVWTPCWILNPPPLYDNQFLREVPSISKNLSSG